MESKQPANEILDIQNDIYRLALSADSLFINGIQFGVLGSVAPGVAQKLADQLLADLATLETNAARISTGVHVQAAAPLTEIRTAVEKATAVVQLLSEFRSRPFDDIHGAVSQITSARDQIANGIQELERRLSTPKPFYESRPKESAAAIEEFVSALESALEREWKASNSKKATSGV
jgi:hypothetical protein